MYLKISSKRYVAYKIIKPLINHGKLEYINKKNINARNQKYVMANKKINKIYFKIIIYKKY